MSSECNQKPDEVFNCSLFKVDQDAIVSCFSSQIKRVTAEPNWNLVKEDWRASETFGDSFTWCYLLNWAAVKSLMLFALGFLLMGFAAFMRLPFSNLDIIKNISFGFGNRWQLLKFKTSQGILILRQWKRSAKKDIVHCTYRSLQYKCFKHWIKTNEHELGSVLRILKKDDIEILISWNPLSQAHCRQAREEKHLKFFIIIGPIFLLWTCWSRRPYRYREIVSSHVSSTFCVRTLNIRAVSEAIEMF